MNENNAILVKPDDAGALADGIKKVLDTSELATHIGQVAFENVQKYTWKKRAQRIISFLEQTQSR